MARPRMQRAIVAGIFALALTAALAGCAPRQAESAAPQAEADVPALTVAWSIDGDCSVCHADHAATHHETDACSSCHQDETALAAAHEGATAYAKMPKKLKKTAVDDALCLSCHYETREALVEATADVQLADSEGTARNPHDTGGVAEHEGIACSDCHTLHADDDVRDVALKQCQSCHHAGVFACYTCHD